MDTQRVNEGTEFFDNSRNTKNTNKSFAPLDIIFIILIIVYLLSTIVFAISLLFLPYGDRLLAFIISPNDPKFPFYSLSFSVALSGLLGGAFYAATGLYRRLAAHKEDRSSSFYKEFNIKLWLFWYLFRPLQGSVLAVVILALLNAGFVGLGNIKNVNLQNLYFQISLGFLVGYGTHEVLHKIDEIIKVTFATSSSKSNSNVFDESQKKVVENQQQNHLHG